MTDAMARIASLGLLLFLAVVSGAAGQQSDPGTAAPGLTQPALPDRPDAAPPFRDGTAGTDAMPNRTITSSDDTPRYVIAPVLTVDQDRLFTDSAWGQRTQTQLENAGQRIAEENERLADQLADEEADLTRRRATLDPTEFRRLAEAFDARATRVRKERAQAVQDLNARAEADRTAFYRAALPIMGEMMQQRGAVAVLDRRTVFVSLDSIDITGDLIARLDETLGDGADTEDALVAPSDDAPEAAPDTDGDDN
jgi:Skp family chaperone for outer membrane proteins